MTGLGHELNITHKPGAFFQGIHMAFSELSTLRHMMIIFSVAGDAFMPNRTVIIL